MSYSISLRSLHRVQYVRLLLFYSVIFQSVIFQSGKFQSCKFSYPLQMLSVCDVSQYPNASKLDQCWVSNDWLYSLGLSQYSAVFETQLVDGRLLNVLSKKDLDKHLSIHNKFHQSSILHAIQLLRMMRFDIQVTSNGSYLLLYVITRAANSN